MWPMQPSPLCIRLQAYCSLLHGDIYDDITQLELIIQGWYQHLAFSVLTYLSEGDQASASLCQRDCAQHEWYQGLV